MFNPKVPLTGPGNTRFSTQSELRTKQIARLCVSVPLCPHRKLQVHGERNDRLEDE